MSPISGAPVPPLLWAMEIQAPQQAPRKSDVGQPPPPRLCSEFAPRASGVPETVPLEHGPQTLRSHPTCSVTRQLWPASACEGMEREARTAACIARGRRTQFAELARVRMSPRNESPKDGNQCRLVRH